MDETNAQIALVSADLAASLRRMKKLGSAPGPGTWTIDESSLRIAWMGMSEVFEGVAQGRAVGVVSGEIMRGLARASATWSGELSIKLYPNELKIGSMIVEAKLREVPPPQLLALNAEPHDLIRVHVRESPERIADAGLDEAVAEALVRLDKSCAAAARSLGWLGVADAELRAWVLARYAPPGRPDVVVVEPSGHGDDPDVVEHGLAAVGDAAREIDLELPRESLGDRVAQEVPEGRLGPGLDVEDLVRAGAGEVAPHDVADGVGAGLPGGEPDGGELPEQVRDLLELHEVELDVLPGGQVAPAAAVALGDVGETVELVGEDGPVRRLDPYHLVVAALALTVDAVGQAEDLEHVLVDLTRQVPAELGLELPDVGHHVRVERHPVQGRAAVGVELDRRHGCSKGEPGR